jgi:hypothetical protein
MHKVFQVDGGFQIFWCPSHPKHYADKVPASERVYRQKQAAYRRCKQLNEEREKKMKSNLRYATKDSIITAIHVLWERGWKVSAESVQEMLRRGHENSSPERIEAVMNEIITPGAREKWLSHFNHESSFAQENGFPWKIAEGELWEVEPELIEK